METYLIGKNNKSFIRSYRTYEEWKLVSGNTFLNSSFSSYRTYEEWKQQPYNNRYTDYNSSYRTYEEWKRISAFVSSSA